MLWICKLTVSSGQVRVTIPKGLVKIMPFLKAGYVQLDDRFYNQIIIKEVKIDGEKTTDGKNTVDGEN